MSKPCLRHLQGFSFNPRFLRVLASDYSQRRYWYSVRNFSNVPGKPILGWRTVYEMNTTAESAYSPGVERLRVGLKLGEEPYFAAFKR